jgi:hypothetical protein
MFLKGRVIDKETSEGIAGAIVVLKNYEPLYGVVSDSMGDCVLEISAIYTRTIAVFHPHYETTYVNFTFVDGDTLSVDFMLNKKSLVSEEFGVITGSVTEEKTHKPLIGVSIELLGTELGATTDRDGRYVIYNVPGGSYTLLGGYINYAGVKDSAVEVSPGETTIRNFVLSPQRIQVTH